MFGFTPRLVKGVETSGVPTTAVVLADPQNKVRVVLVDDRHKLASYRLQE